MSTDHNDTQPDQAQASLEDMAERLKPLFPGLLGIEWVKLEPEHVQARLLVRMELCTAGNSLHGGAFMALADTVGAVATLFNCPKAHAPRPLSQKQISCAAPPSAAMCWPTLALCTAAAAPMCGKQESAMKPVSYAP